MRYIRASLGSAKAFFRNLSALFHHTFLQTIFFHSYNRTARIYGNTYAHQLKGERGITLIDALVGTALMLLVFVGIAAVFQISLDVVINSKIRAGAIALLNERMEYLRSLSYTQIGVEGGIPAGIVPQIETVSWNGASYIRRTSVVYSDDPGDGLGGADENAIIADYKTIRVEVSWGSRQGERSITLAGRVSPTGVETAVPGGILTMYVVNAAALAVPDARVDIINTETIPAINIRTYTNSEGIVSFIGAPAASNYQVTVSRPGYSSAQTYSATTENPNPNPRHLTVVNDQTTSATFIIDFLATKTVQTFGPSTVATWEDMFDDDSKLVLMQDATVSGGHVRVAGPAPFPPVAVIQSVPIAPADIWRWGTLSWDDSEPGDTYVTYYIYDGNGVVPVPNSVLPGNDTGFTDSPVDFSTVPVSEYPSIRIHAVLTTEPPAGIPSINEWDVTYELMPLHADLSFSMRGFKTIGNNPTVYKYDQTHSSGASASITLSNIEWDTYVLSVATTSGYSLAESCNPQPEMLLPGNTQTTHLYVLPYSTNTLLVDVRSNAGDLISGASVRLYKTEYDETVSTSPCGQVFFGDLAPGTYSIEASKAGYQTYSNSDVNVADVSQMSVVLNSL